MNNCFSRRTVIAGGAAVAGAFAAPSFANPDRRQPNIVFMMADDLGYADDFGVDD